MASSSPSASPEQGGNVGTHPGCRAHIAANRRGVWQSMRAAMISGDAYTFPEYQKMFKEAGFSQTSFYPIQRTRNNCLFPEDSCGC
jgi:hypothetical protein